MATRRVDGVLTILDLHEILKGLEEYAKVFKEFLEAMVVAENHANPEVSNSPCPAFKKVKKCHRVSYNNK